MLAILQLIMPAISAILGKVIQDPQVAANAQIEIQKALIERETEIQKSISDAAKAQTEVNLREAEHPSIFVAGWRPFIGWVCGVGAAYAFVIQPLFSLVLWAWNGASGTPPVPDTAQLMTMLGGLLGLGVLRTVEKSQGVERISMSRPTLRRAE